MPIDLDGLYELLDIRRRARKMSEFVIVYDPSEYGFVSGGINRLLLAEAVQEGAHVFISREIADMVRRMERRGWSEEALKQPFDPLNLRTEDPEKGNDPMLLDAVL